MLCGNLAAPIELRLLRATTAGALRGLLKLPEASTRVKTLEEAFKCFKNEFVHPVRHNWFVISVWCLFPRGLILD